MGDTKNLTQAEAIQEMKKLAESINVCMFCTQSSDLPFQTRPMGTAKIDNSGDFWFLSDIESDKNNEIKKDDKVQLIYSQPGGSKFMTVYGKAAVSKDRKKIDELWNDLDKAWFTQGKDDPRISVIHVMPEQAYYWDTKYGKMVAMLAIAAGAVTGRTMDTGIEGQLQVKKSSHL
jgi:general stress protein 26